ncbi:MAG: ABC transporter substrate-binding protein [Thermoleophilia bacterium]
MGSPPRSRAPDSSDGRSRRLWEGHNGRLHYKQHRSSSDDPFCANDFHPAPATSQTAGDSKLTLTDMGGNTVVVPATVNRIAITCQGGAAQAVSVMGGASKIVALPSQKKFTTLLKAYPDLAQLPDVGTFDNVNIESLLSVKPDVVIASKTAKKGNAAIRNAGIPVVEINTGANNKPESCIKEFKLIGDLLGDPATAAELTTFWEKQMQAINDRLQNLSADERVRVYYVLGALTHTNGGDAWGQALITAAGGVNVAQSLNNVKHCIQNNAKTWT